MVQLGFALLRFSSFCLPFLALFDFALHFPGSLPGFAWLRLPPLGFVWLSARLWPPASAASGPWSTDDRSEAPKAPHSPRCPPQRQQSTETGPLTQPNPSSTGCQLSSRHRAKHCSPPKHGSGEEAYFGRGRSPDFS